MRTNRRQRIFLLLRILEIGALLCWALDARAAFIPLDASGCVPNEPTTTDTCAEKIIESATAAGIRDALWECTGASTSIIYCPFTWPSDNPATLTNTISSFTDGADTNTGHNTIWSTKLACFAAGDSVDDFAWSGVTGQTSTVANGANAKVIQTGASSAITPNKHAAGQDCWAQIIRAGGGSDTNTGSARFRKALLQ